MIRKTVPKKVNDLMLQNICEQFWLIVYHNFDIKELAVNEKDYRGSKLRVNVIPYLCHYLHFFNYCF